MSDFRDPYDLLMRNSAYEPYARGGGSAWGWIVAAVFLVIVLGITFGVRHEPSRLASNQMAPPPATHALPLAPPVSTESSASDGPRACSGSSPRASRAVPAVV